MRRPEYAGPPMAALPPYHATIAPVTAAQLGPSWHAGCPVGPSQLRRLFVSYVGFDGRAHRGRADRQPRRRERRRAGLPRPLQRALPRAQDAAGLGLRRRTTPARPPPTTRRRSTAATPSRPVRSAGRRTPTARRSTSTPSRTRTSKADASCRRRGTRIATGRATGRGWRSRAACSCVRSPRSAGAGAGAGRRRPDYQHFSRSGG